MGRGPIRRRDAHRHRLDGALVELVRLRGPLFEDLLLFRREFRDELAVRYALCHVGCSFTVVPPGLRPGRRYLMLAAPPGEESLRAALRLLIQTRAWSPGSAYHPTVRLLVPPRRRSVAAAYASRRECGATWKARAYQSSASRQGSVGFGNDLTVSAAESATFVGAVVGHGHPSGRSNAGGAPAQPAVAMRTGPGCVKGGPLAGAALHMVPVVR